MECTMIMAVTIDNRLEDAPKFQELITRNGCLIRTRLGLHEADSCSKKGLILLQLCGKAENIEALGKEINALNSAKATWMQIDL